MLTVVILAAGKGTRMNDSSIPKVCRKVGNKTMIEMVVATASQLSPKNICLVVSSENKEIIQKTLSDFPNLIYVEQKEINGTASAVLTAQDFFSNTDLLVLLGDVPLIKSSTLHECITENTILGFQDTDINNRFGRIILKANKVEKIVEYTEANEDEKLVTSVNSGMLFLKNGYTIFLNQIDNNNSKKEYYLTDIVKILRKHDVSINYLEASNEECMGANTPSDLEKINSCL